jgi:uncharacterized protein (DUF983 family)
MNAKPASFFTILSRCLKSECPVCGEGRLFAHITRVESVGEIFFPLEKCAVCGFKFAREPGYYLGVLMPVLPILSLPMGAFFAAVSYFYLNLDLDSVFAALILGLIVGCLMCFRTSIALYVTFDHSIRPPTEKI